MTRALITGITGMVGSHLADYLLANTDWDIYGMLRWRSPLDNIEHLVQRINDADRAHLVYADLSEEAGLRHAVRAAAPDYVFHLAAQSFPQTSFASPADTIDTNMQGTVRLLEALKDHAPAALIHVCSSSEVYGRVSADKLPIAEDCPFAPASPYAISKAGADLAAQHYAAAYGMKILVSRMFTHTGPRRGDVFVESSFSKQLAMIEAGQLAPVIRHGNLDSIRTITDVRDAVRAYYMLLTINPQPGQVYNIGGGVAFSVREILNQLIGISGVSCSLEVDPARMRPVDADLQVPNCSKFKNHTGWEPRISYEQTMLELLNYWRERVRKHAHLTR